MAKKKPKKSRKEKRLTKAAKRLEEEEWRPPVRPKS
jgi:hypothetical protein